jgi:hypothetical protein
VGYDADGIWRFRSSPKRWPGHPRLRASGIRGWASSRSTTLLIDKICERQNRRCRRRRATLRKEREGWTPSFIGRCRGSMAGHPPRLMSHRDRALLC